MTEKTCPVRVLVADDYQPDRELTVRHLGKAWPFPHAMAVECAADGRMALEQLNSRRFDLAVLDWKMPYLDGGEVLRKVRQDGLRLPVVVISGQPPEEIAPQLTTMAAAFIHKDELNPTSFRQAITASLALPGVQWTM